MEDNVKKFLVETSKRIGEYAQDSFCSGTESDCEDTNIKSPIEQLLYIALVATREFNIIDDFDVITHPSGKECFIVGLCINPQFPIGKYRCDFEISYGTTASQENRWRQRIFNKIIVECDGHEFHDKDEKQRRYEQQRDRFLQNKGYKVLHYTGKEIYENPFKIAKEILETITDMNIDMLSVGGKK